MFLTCAIYTYNRRMPERARYIPWPFRPEQSRSTQMSAGYALTKQKKTNKMKTLLIAIVSILPLVAGAEPQMKPMDLSKRTGLVEQMPGAPTPMIQNPSWYMIANRPGPTIPPGWQLVGIEAVLQNGSSMNGWLMSLFNPTTRQTYGWLIGTN